MFFGLYIPHNPDLSQCDTGTDISKLERNIETVGEREERESRRDRKRGKKEERRKIKGREGKERKREGEGLGVR